MQMATLIANRRSRSCARVWDVLVDRRVHAAIGATGIACAVAGTLLLAASDFLVDARAFGLQTGFMVAATVAAALVWLRRRPRNGVGVLLLALAFATSVVALQGADNAYLHSLGVVIEPVFFLLGYLVVFAFPEGGLPRVPERLILVGMTLYFMVAFVPWMLFSPVVPGGAPLAGCDPCPANGLMLDDRPAIAASAGISLTWTVIVLLTATLVCLVYRVARASRPRRRTLLPVYIPAMILTVPLLAFHGFAAGVIELDPQTLKDAGWAIVVARCALPLGFLVSIAQASVFADGALKGLIDELVAHPNARRLRAIVAEALDDASLELRGGDTFVDSRGEPLASMVATDGRATRRVGTPGEAVAAIWHDPALDTDPELVRAASQATLLALENDRLQGELTASHARVVAAGDAARLRIQRDLHDGAQQKLIALQIKLALAQELAGDDSEIAARLDEVGYALVDAVEELRDLARGVNLPVLRDFGLRAALASAAQSSAPPTTLVADGISRYPSDVETAVYFCCLESLQNVARHAGADARAVVRVSERDTALCFEVLDDGVGGAVEPAHSQGSGLANMTERIAAVRGTLTVESAVGGGTRIEGRIPLTA
jgi:signal transduction histidine kinase